MEGDSEFGSNLVFLKRLESFEKSLELSALYNSNTIIIILEMGLGKKFYKKCAVFCCRSNLNERFS